MNHWKYNWNHFDELEELAEASLEYTLFYNTYTNYHIISELNIHSNNAKTFDFPLNYKNFVSFPSTCIDRHWNHYKSGQSHLTDFIGVEPSKKRKRRTSFTPQALELLNAHFERNTHPSGEFFFPIFFFIIKKNKNIGWTFWNKIIRGQFNSLVNFFLENW